MENIISLSKFLAIYYGFEGDGLKQLRHEDVKKHFKNVRVCHNEDINDLILKKDVVLVTDGKKILPYYSKELEHNDYDIHVTKDIEKSKEIITKKVTDMSNYELYQTLNIRFNRRSKSKEARNELINRGELPKKEHKLKREKEYIKSKYIEEDF